jgi:glutamine synthetase
VPGFEAPVNLAYSSRNRSAAVRIPMYSASPKAKRIEFRTPDPSCNGYLAFSAMLMAALDGIENKIDPGDPLDKNIYDLPPEELAEIPSAPGSLDEALAPWGRPRLPAQGRRLHQGCHRHVDRLQDRKRSQPGEAAAASPRVLPLLRHLTR